MRHARTLLLVLGLAAACATGKEDRGETRDAKTPSAPPRGKPTAKTADPFVGDKPVPRASEDEAREFARIWELYRRDDPSWPLERDRFKRRSDAAAYVLAGHLLRHYMQLNEQRARYPRELARVKDEIVAAGEPCVPVLIDTMVLPEVPLQDGVAWRPDDLTRQDCLDMLERMGARSVPLMLRAVGRASTDEKGRRLLALALGGTKDARAFETLVRLLRTDPSWQVRADAATGLAKLGDMRALEPLKEARQRDTDPAVVRRAGKAAYELEHGKP